MTQTITTQYHALDTSEGLNRRFAGVVLPGVYSGYRVSPNGGSSNSLDITLGNDASSVLITSEGVRIEESANLPGELTIDPADATLTRIDLVVAEYQYVPNTNVTQTYKVIKGSNQVDTTLSAVAPDVENEFQIPLAEVTVRPKNAFSGTASAQVEVTDIRQRPNAAFVQQGQEANLRPEISPLDSTRIYVFPGIFLSVDSTSVVEFEGGHSSVIDASTYATNETRFVQFGITDAGVVEVIGEAATEADLPDLTRNTFPLATAETRRSGDSVLIISLKDIRFPFARRQAKLNEEADYKGLLADSVFQSMFVDTLTDSTNLDLTTVALQTSGTSTDVTAAIDSKDTSLTFTFSGANASVPSEDVILGTLDLLDGGNISNVQQFMLVDDSSFDGLRFQYSASSSSGGFTTTTFRPNEIVRIPNGVNKLFIRFIVPRSAFLSDKTAKIFSYAVLTNLDEAVLNTATVGDLGLAGLRNSLNNLIANGNFYYWNRLDFEGGQPDLTTLEDITFTADIASDEINLADGWQITSAAGQFSGGLAKRVRLDTSGSEAITALEVTPSSSGGTAPIVEYRVPTGFELEGRKITFSVDYESGIANNFAIGVAVYERTSAGLVLKESNELLNPDTQGTLTVQSTSVIPGDCAEIGLYIRFQATDAVARIFKARAVSGDFTTIPFTPVANAVGALRQYYEKGRAFFSTNATEGDIVGFSTQLGTPKLPIGSITGRVFQTGDTNRSVNIADISIQADENSVIFSSSASTSGNATLDVDWESFVRYSGGLL